MKVVKVSTGADGRSVLEHVPAAALAAVRLAALPMHQVLLRRTVPAEQPAFHNPTGPMWVVTLSGSARITCGDGVTVVMGPGDVLWADDIDGEGHLTEELSAERLTLVCRIEDDGVWPEGLDT